MLVGYVSDERFVGLSDVSFEFRGGNGVVTANSTISGAVCADVEPGAYEVVLGRDGYGSKIVAMEVDSSRPHQFRLLSNTLYGYMWPKCARSGEQSQFRVHSIEEYNLERWRYGSSKEFVRQIGTLDEHGPRATVQIAPDRRLQPIGRPMDHARYHNTRWNHSKPALDDPRPRSRPDSPPFVKVFYAAAGIRRCH
jgi:hypothetical protein